MNFELIKTGATKLLGSKALVLQKHSPTIMVVTGVVGMTLAVVEASRATLKVEGILQEHNETMDTINNYIEAANEDGEVWAFDEDNEEVVVTVKELDQDKIKVYAKTTVKLAKNYAPTASLLIVSGVLILSGYNILNKRQAAIAAAYKAMDESFRDYRNKVVDKYGEDADLSFKHVTERDKISYVDEETGKTKKKTVDTFSDTAKASMYSRLFTGDMLNWSNNMDFNIDYLEAHEKHANTILKARGHLFLNEVLDMLDYDRTDVGAIAGWRLHGDGDGYVSFDIKEVFQTVTALSGKEVPDRAILLSFNVDPGTIFDKL